jgi:uncharacterized protein YjbI with pentapeptide repeats
MGLEEKAKPHASLKMKDKAPISEFNFGPDAQELTPFDVSTLMQEYADGRRKFNQVDLKSANLSHAHLPYVQLEESLLQKADLRNAILAGASLNHVDLSASNLSHTNLIAADLIRAKLAGANLAGAFLSGANLSGANLRKSNLTDCTLAGANLSGVDFSGATLKNTNMAGATLRGANLSAVDISQLDLTGVSLEGTILSAEQGGATWTALKSGSPTGPSEGTTQPESSLGSSIESAPLDAFDNSYEELIQDLAEATDWHGSFEAAFGEPEISDADLEDADLNAGEPADEAVPLQSPFEPNHAAPAQSPFEADDGLSSFVSVESEPVSGETAFDADGLEPHEAFSGTNGTDLNTLSLVPFPAAPPSPFLAPSSPSTPETAEPAAPALEPDQDDEPIIQLPASSDSVDPGQPAISPDDMQGRTSAPVEESAQAKKKSAQAKESSLPPTAPDDPAVEDEATAETVLLPRDRYSKNNPHQEEVIKSIQAVLNRRTHYSLQRKLLEIYAKRCAITGCPIRPLLDTVLIDGGGTAVADHPSNGLVLRTDIKILYNLYLIAVHPTKYTVMLAPSLRTSSYGDLEGQKITLPKQVIYHPQREYLQAHLDHCKWVNYGSSAEAAGESASSTTVHERRSEEASGPWRQNLMTKGALVLGGLVVGSLFSGLVWFFLPLRSINVADSPPPEVEDVGEDAIPSVTIDPENLIRLQLGPLVYPLGGVIYDENAYLSVAQLRQAGIISGLMASAEQIQFNGQRYIKASFVESLGFPPSWDADTRTVALDCCTDPEIEPINIAVEDQTIAEEGLIIDGSSYVPVEALDPLNTAQVRVPPDNFVEVDRRFYIKSSGLDEIGFEVSWDADARILNLE